MPPAERKRGSDSGQWGPSSVRSYFLFARRPCLVRVVCACVRARAYTLRFSPLFKKIKFHWLACYLINCHPDRRNEITAFVQLTCLNIVIATKIVKATFPLFSAPLIDLSLFEGSCSRRKSTCIFLDYWKRFTSKPACVCSVIEGCSETGDLCDVQNMFEKLGPLLAFYYLLLLSLPKAISCSHRDFLPYSYVWRSYPIYLPTFWLRQLYSYFYRRFTPPAPSTKAVSQCIKSKAKQDNAWKWWRFIFCTQEGNSPRGPVGSSIQTDENIQGEIRGKAFYTYDRTEK